MSEHMSMPCHERFDDTVAMPAPAVIFAPDGAIIVPLLEWILRNLLKQCAEKVNEHWHHAEFFVTDDPAIVTETVSSHCPECIAGNQRARAFLKDNPGKQLIVGRIWWVGA